METKVAFIDLETTGTDPSKHGVVSIAGLIRRKGKPDDTFTLRVKPFETDVVEVEAMKINGLDPKEGFTPKEAYKQLLTIFGRHVDKYNKRDKMFFAAYNAQFDMQFVRRFFEKCGDQYFGSWFWFPPIDIMGMALVGLMDKRPSMENFKLATVARTLGIEFDLEKAHGAEYDIRKAIELYDKLELVRCGNLKPTNSGSALTLTPLLPSVWQEAIGGGESDP